MPDPIAQPTMTAGAASYPPAYNASGAHLDRALRRYIKARVNRDEPLTEMTRTSVDSAIRRAVAGA